MKRLLFTLLIGVFVFVSFASASVTYYDLENNEDIDYKERITKTYADFDHKYAVTKTTYAYYDNEDRHSTYDYRHGYSYRDSSDYWEDRHEYDKDYQVTFVYDGDNNEMYLKKKYKSDNPRDHDRHYGKDK